MRFILLVISLLTMTVSCAKKDSSKEIFKNKIASTNFLTKDQNLLVTDISDQWWLEFNDETLNQLIKLGLQNNKDIQMANLAIVTSRQINNINISTLFPSGSVGITRQRFASPGFGPHGVSYDLFQATIDASWELDFFGKNLDRYKAGKLRFLKDAQLYKASALRITSEISQNYLALKATQKQIKNLQEIFAANQELSLLAIQEEKNGKVSKSDIFKSEINLNSAKSNLLEAQASEKILTYKLATLIGETPEKIIEIFNSFKTNEFTNYSFSPIPVGLKSDILRRRPDILAAEYEIDAANFEQSAQFKEFFPSFTLSARIGGGAKDLSNVLSDTANVKDIRGGISLPIFSFGSLIAEYKISKAKAKTAIFNYEKTVLTAIEECESQLVRYTNSLEIENNSKLSLLAAQKILQIDKNKKKLGVITKQQAINSKITNLLSENDFLQKKLNSLSNLISLHKAIGGGFEGYEMRFEKERVLWVKNNQK